MCLSTPSTVANAEAEITYSLTQQTTMADEGGGSRIWEENHDENLSYDLISASKSNRKRSKDTRSIDGDTIPRQTLSRWNLKQRRTSESDSTTQRPTSSTSSCHTHRPTACTAIGLWWSSYGYKRSKCPRPFTRV